MPEPTQTTTHTASFHEPRRSWATKTKDGDEIVCHMGMTGRISVASLLAHMATIAPEVTTEQMLINFSTLKWTEPSTEEDREVREAWLVRQAERTEKWERETLTRLIKKYGVPEDVDPADVPEDVPAGVGG